MNLFSLNKKSNLSLVFDIRDTFITIAAVSFEIGKKPEMILCKNFHIDIPVLVVGHTTDKHYKKYLISMIKTLDQGIVSIRRDLIKIGNTIQIKKYFFFIDSPWTVSQSKLIRVLKDKAFEINNSLLEKIILTEEKEATKVIEKQSNKDWVVFEEKIIQSKLNGYKVEKIFGRKTFDLEIEMFVSFIPKEIRNKVLFLINQKVGDSAKRHLNSSTIASYSFFRDLFPNKNNFIYVDLGRVLTDVYIVRNDVIEGVASFPFGENHMVKSVMAKMKVSEHIVLSALDIYHSENNNNEEKQKIENLVLESIQNWTKKLEKVISQISYEADLPNTIFIIPNSEVSKLLIKEMTKQKQESFRILNMNMRVEVITEGIINNFITNAKVFAGEPYIKMDIAFLDRILREK
jgi:hypothetical protein